jgi:tRNA(Ile)-lysidine synthase
MPLRSDSTADIPRFEQRLAAQLERACVRSTLVVVACSGGADSTALLLGLDRLRRDFQLTLTAAHLDHGLRPDSGHDAEAVRQLSAELGIHCVTRTATTTLRADRVSEEAARDWRREFYRDTAREQRASWVATAHTADDQAETVLHRIVRGTGVRGLTGIAAIRPLGPDTMLLRPLLGTTRAELEDWLRSQGRTWRTDPTNAEPRFTRNRIRNNLLPQLRREFNPQVDAALQRLAEQAGEINLWLTEQADRALAQALLEATPSLVRLSVAPLSSWPAVVVREAFVRLWHQQGWREQGLTSDHWNRLARCAQSTQTTDRWQLPHGIDVRREGTLLRLHLSGQ